MGDSTVATFVLAPADDQYDLVNTQNNSRVYSLGAGLAIVKGG
jgi:hypothetical protein